MEKSKRISKRNDDADECAMHILAPCSPLPATPPQSLGPVPAKSFWPAMSFSAFRVVLRLQAYVVVLLGGQHAHVQVITQTRSA